MNEARVNIQSVIERTCYIKARATWGTAFAIESNERQYLITAKHIVDNAAGRVQSGEEVAIYSDCGPKVVTPLRIEVSDGDPDQGAGDVAALQMPRPLSFQSRTPTLARREDLFVTQRVAMPTAEYFGVFGPPFVVTTRTGTISAIMKRGHRGPYTGDFLLGIEAYQGFSGSPVIYWDTEGQPRLAGVAARLSWRAIPVLGPGSVHTGFIGCFHISHALELVRAMD